MAEMKDLLKMIEAVDPSDTAMMDEIDYRFFCWLQNMPYTQSIHLGHKRDLINKYTRSRDALKAIRPEGWVLFSVEMYTGEVSYGIWQEHSETIGSRAKLNSAYLPTEELAELHAIIQAIAHERNAE